MRKHAMCMLLMLCMIYLGAAGLAEEAQPLPPEAAALVGQAYPGYSVAAFSGYDPLAMVLTDGEHNTLVLAGRNADGSYAVTLENARAVRDGEKASLLMETDDSLWIVCSFFSITEQINAKLMDGQWSVVGTFSYEPCGGDQYEVVQSWTAGGKLDYEVSLEDELGNILSRKEYPPIPVDESYAQGRLLSCFDIETCTLRPDYGFVDCRGMAGVLLEEGDTLLDIDLKPDALALLVEKPSGTRRLRMAARDGAQYAVRETSDLPPQTSMDTFHAGDEGIILVSWADGQELDAGFRGAGDAWRLSWVMGEETLTFVYDGVTNESFIGRNDDIVYGAAPDRDLFAVDLAALPRSLDEAVARMDVDVYAYVNNPNPADRLHLRVKPDRGAASLGKFYNRTPVKVLERGKTWTRVRIGNDKCGYEGYMMTQYLAFGAQKDAVACAFPQESVRDDLPEGVAVLREPRDSAEAVATFTGAMGDFIIGVVGDEWYVLMCADGTVGYARQSNFWEGNG